MMQLKCVIVAPFPNTVTKLQTESLSIERPHTATKGRRNELAKDLSAKVSDFVIQFATFTLNFASTDLSFRMETGIIVLGNIAVSVV